MTEIAAILGLSLIGSVIGLAGGATFLMVNKLRQLLIIYSTPFAAGIMITVSLMGLIPEAEHLIGESVFGITLLALLGAYIFENSLFDLHHHDHSDPQNHKHHHKSSVPLVVIGDTIHNFIDGVAIAASYLINPGLGLITALSTLLHEIPHEIGDFGILLKAGFSKKRVFFINLISSLSTVLGALFVYFLGASDSVLGVLLAIAAGMFLYLGASDFLPKANHGIEKKKAIGVLLLGVLLMYGTFLIIPH